MKLSPLHNSRKTHNAVQLVGFNYYKILVEITLCDNLYSMLVPVIQKRKQ